MRRKPIQIVDSGRHSLYALCDDGTIWWLDAYGGWHKQKTVPQPKKKAAPPRSNDNENCRDGGLIEAIKSLREEYLCSLKDAKDAAEIGTFRQARLFLESKGFTSRFAV